MFIEDVNGIDQLAMNVELKLIKGAIADAHRR